MWAGDWFRTAVGSCSVFASDKIVDDVRNLLGEEAGNGISHLLVLFGTRTAEEVVIRKCLQPCCLPDGQRSTLLRIGVNKVVPVL